MLGGAGRCWEVLGGAGRCWEVLGGAGRCWEAEGGGRRAEGGGSVPYYLCRLMLVEYFHQA